MEPHKPKSFQHKERKDTDESLGAERVKTNAELKQVRGKSDQKTHQELELQREKTDQAVSSARAKSDDDRDHERDASGYDRMDDRRTGDYRLRTERQRSDKAVAAERARSDLAIETERQSKSIAEDQILRNEREATDQHLKVERESTDSASVELSDEVAEHLKTKASLTTRDEFLAIVSHDLRNPIGAISSCMGMLLEDSDSLKADEDLKSWVMFAKRNADSALRLIGDLLDMERIASGKLQVSFRDEEIGEVIREAAQNYTLAAAAKGVLLKITPLKSPETLCCDSDRIMQVLNNILGNALKFTPEGGMIEVKVLPADSEITIVISDTGTGIPAEKIDHIFERFAQLGMKDRRGLGLGLHISKMLVEAHRGSLTVDSTEGKGSTFSLTLPRRQ